MTINLKKILLKYYKEKAKPVELILRKNKGDIRCSNKNGTIREKYNDTIFFLAGNELEGESTKHLDDGIFELRVKFSSDITRILYFFHIGKIKVDSKPLGSLRFFRENIVKDIKCV